MAFNLSRLVRRTPATDPSANQPPVAGATEAAHDRYANQEVAYAHQAGGQAADAQGLVQYDSTDWDFARLDASSPKLAEAVSSSQHAYIGETEKHSEPVANVLGDEFSSVSLDGDGPSTLVTGLGEHQQQLEWAGADSEFDVDLDIDIDIP